MPDTVTTGTRRSDDQMTHLERINGPRELTADDWVWCGPKPGETTKLAPAPTWEPDPMMVGVIFENHPAPTDDEPA